MKIGIESSLTSLKEYLEQNNHKVIEMNGSKKVSKRSLKKYDAIVTSGLDSNFLGMQDTMSKAPVITANGKTVEEIYNEITSRLE